MRTNKGAVIGLTAILGITGLTWMGTMRGPAYLPHGTPTPMFSYRVERLADPPSRWYGEFHATQEALGLTGVVKDAIEGDYGRDEQFDKERFHKDLKESLEHQGNYDERVYKEIEPLLNDVVNDVPTILSEEFSKMPKKQPGESFDDWGKRMEVWGNDLERRMDTWGAEMDRKAQQIEEKVGKDYQR